jgi:hypothetical protein
MRPLAVQVFVRGAGAYSSGIEAEWGSIKSKHYLMKIIITNKRMATVSVPTITAGSRRNRWAALTPMGTRRKYQATAPHKGTRLKTRQKPGLAVITSHSL